VGRMRKQEIGKYERQQLWVYQISTGSLLSA